MSSSASNGNDGLRRPQRHRPKQAEVSGSETHVQCRICRGWYQAITYTHLRYKHGIEDPSSYKQKYSLAKITAPEVRVRIAEQKILVDPHAIDYIRRHWGKRSIKEITSYLGINASTVRAHALKLGLGLLVEKWNRPKITAALRSARRRGMPLHSGAARRALGPLYKAAQKYFGSWRKALEDAGIPYKHVARRGPFESWTEPRITAAILELNKSGQDCDYAFIQKWHRKLYAAARNHFGSWREARRAAGLPDGRAMR